MSIEIPSLQGQGQILSGNFWLYVIWTHLRPSHWLHNTIVTLTLVVEIVVRNISTTHISHIAEEFE